ncbi:MAG: 4-hydroxy-tetrahydrodipicolinate synthase [Lachnospiraceae bacterium]|nr:4-hydroxy-tetrahydrodipicolinate synthase [Lachnospiraceae bacterium]
MAIFKGAGVAIVTPFKKDLSINYEKLDALLTEQIDQGTDAIIICGTTGESATLTETEHTNAIRFTVERVKKRIPVIAGTGSNCTATAIRLSKEAEEVGADAALVVTPYYNKATQNGLINHFESIAANIKLPIIMYNIPGRTGIGMAAHTIAHLIKHVDNIVGVKESTGDIGFVARTMNLCDGKLELYSGNDDQIVPLLSLGGLGVISVISNIAPKYTHDIVSTYHAGDTKTACQMQLKAMPMIDALFCEVNPIPVKAAMNLLGKEVGSLRNPLTEIEPQHLQLLRKAMEDFGIL